MIYINGCKTEKWSSFQMTFNVNINSSELWEGIITS